MPTVRWGVHPVLEAALAVLGEERAEAIALPPKATLDTGRLVEIGLLCCEHVRSRVGRGDAARFDHLVALARRELGDRARREDAAWQRELTHAARDREHGRGAIVVAALTAEVAWADLLRGAPGAALEATGLCREATQHTAKLLAADEPALVAFVRALAALVGGGA